MRAKSAETGPLVDDCRHHGLRVPEIDRVTAATTT
jgi:hypothetical protein